MSVARLGRDGVVWLASATLVIYLLFYLTPVLGDAALGSFSELYAEIPLLLLAAGALCYRLRRVEHPEERRFWALWALSFGCWLAGALAMVVAYKVELAWVELAADSMFQLSFLAAILSADQRPHLPAGWSERDISYRFSTAGTLLFFFALIVYFFSIPAVLSGGGESQWYPTSYLIIALDALLAVRFLHLCWICRHRQWRAIYTLFAVISSLWILTDTLEYLVVDGRISLSYGTPWDFLWYVPFLAVVAAHAVRLQQATAARGPAVTVLREHDEGEAAAPDLLVIYAVLFPMLHLSLTSIGVMGTVGSAARQTLVLASLTAFIALAVAQHRLLEKRNRELQSAVAARAKSEQLQQSRKLEAIGRLAGGVAHDFNNLLMVIQARASLLRDAGRAGDPDLGALDEIVKAAERGATLTRQLLAFSRKQVLQPEPLDLNRVIEDTEGVLHRLIGERIALRTRLAVDLGTIEGDPGQILRVILNLAANARDAMPEGGSLDIETGNAELSEEDATRMASAVPGPYVGLTVRDTGAGMDEDTQDRIFEPFYSTKNLGTGLGLATVYGIVTQSGGFIRVSSRRGEGTAFQVFFPRSEAPVFETEDLPVAEPDPDRRATVLLAEDEVSVRAVVRDLLEVADLHVLEAGNGEDAATLARDHEGPIDVLLTDVVMPGLDGWQLADAVRTQRPEIRVLYMSGYPEPLDDERAPVPGEGFLQKPFTPEQLIRRLGDLLGDRELSSRIAS